MAHRESMKAEAVVREVDERWGSDCAGCELALLGHDIVLSLVLGFRDAPRCARCLAAAVAQEPHEFLRQAAARVRRLDCFRAGWVHADRRLAASGPWPEDRFPSEFALYESDAELEGGVGDEYDPDGPPSSGLPDEASVAAVYDAGDLSCGDLVLELRKRLQGLSAGETLRVRATDPAAPRDLPSWCRITRHALTGERPPYYWIRRRED